MATIKDPQDETIAVGQPVMDPQYTGNQPVGGQYPNATTVSKAAANAIVSVVPDVSPEKEVKCCLCF